MDKFAADLQALLEPGVSLFLPLFEEATFTFASPRAAAYEAAALARECGRVRLRGCTRTGGLYVAHLVWDHTEDRIKVREERNLVL